MWPKVSKITSTKQHEEALHLYFVAQAALEELRHQLLPIADRQSIEEMCGKIDQLNYKLYFMVVHEEESADRVFD